LVNGAILLLMAGYFLIHAIDRLSHPHHVEMNGTWMLWGAGLGLLINSIAAGLLVKAKKNSLNAKSAYYHLLTDIAHACIEISVALFIVNYHFFWLDSALSLVLIAFMLINGIRICLEACRILMSIAPQNISVASIQSFLQSQEGVIAVEDIHLWSITTGKHTLTAHLKLQDMSFFSSETTTRLEAVLREHYDICHITLQLSL
jgi:cobalt-zinc-cadmium efflux system protein